MTEIYIVKYNYETYEDYTIYPIKAFRDKQKAEEFVKECQGECLRISAKIEDYWSKYQKEYDELRKILREKITKKQFRHDLKEAKRNVEIMTGEKDIINSHKHHPNYIAHPKEEFSYQIDVLELVE